MFNLLILLICSVAINNFLFERLFNNDVYLSQQVLLNIQEDLEKISFPYIFNLNALFISIILGLLVIILIKFTNSDRIDSSDPVEFLKTFMKIIFIYSGSLFSIMYMLRLYNFSRGLLVISILIVPTVLFILIFLLNLNMYSRFKKNKLYFFIPFSLFILGFTILSFQRSIESVSVESITTTTTIPDIQIGINNQSECGEWLGSENYGGCLMGSRILEVTKYSESLNNIITFGNNLYILDVFGVVYQNSPENIFLDISNKVLNRIDLDSGEYGLFSLAFHPTDDFFLISYSDLQNHLVIEKYFLNDDKKPIKDNSEELLRIPNPGCCHYSGNIIWSDYFKDFLISIGDMESNVIPLENSEPLDTTQPRGKILFLDNNISNPDLLASTDRYKPRTDILAYGLRNPWKTVEYNKKLFVVDIGNYEQEELNIVELDNFVDTKKPFLFGWPFFEGTIENQIDYTEILLHDQNTKTSIKSYIKENSIQPSLYYYHQAPTKYRAALIGGGVISNKSSKYFEHYIFADFLSNELFAYDFNNDKAYIIPISNLGTNINSIALSPNGDDVVFATTWSGQLIKIQLP
jgi:hypothetical protein